MVNDATQIYMLVSSDWYTHKWLMSFCLSKDELRMFS